MAPSGGTIKAHNDLIKENKFVWMGKFGKRIAEAVLDKIRDQIKKGKNSYIFLVQRYAGDYKVYAGLIEDATNEQARIDSDKVPEYYANKKWMVKTWFKISKFIPLNSDVLNVIDGKSSHLPIIKSLGKSMAGMMYFLMNENFDIMKYRVKKKKD